MATISENLQTIADSTAAIKQAIIDKGGTIEGDITTWASAINNLSGEGNTSNIRVFSVNGKGKFAYEIGMTWQEWFDSDYGKSAYYESSIEYMYFNNSDNCVQIFQHTIGNSYLTTTKNEESFILLTDSINPQIENYYSWSNNYD